MLGHEISGGRSVTTTLKGGHVAWLPALSVAVHDTNVTPRLKVLPDAGEHDDDAIPELSTAANVQATVAVGVLPLVTITLNGVAIEYGGQVSVGATLSRFLTKKEQKDTFPAKFAAEQPTYITPTSVNEIGLVTLHD